MSDFKSPPLLTVVTPVAKMAGRLGNLRTWLFNLEDLSIEVILVHDKHDEETGNELIAITNELKNDQVKLIEGVYGAPGLARNVGLDIAKGDWVCFWDSDDIPVVSEFFQMLKSVKKDEQDCVVGGFSVVNDLDGSKKSFLLSKNYMDDIAINPGIWRFAFKRHSIAQQRFSHLRMAEDQLLLAEYFATDRQVQSYPGTVYHYFTGDAFHLTKQKVAINDLPLVSSKTLHILRNEDAHNVRFISILFSRQILTAIKLGAMSAKVRALGILLLALISVSNSKKTLILKSSWFIIKKKRSL